MKQADFSKLAIAIDSLTPCQRHLYLERLQDPDAIPAIIEHLGQQLQSDLKYPAEELSKSYIVIAVELATKP
jgi:hypothetical protein